MTIEWSVAVGGWYAALRKVREGITFVNDLNKSMTDVAIVTGQSRNELDRTAESYNRMAQSMAQSTKDVADASVTFIRQGRDIVETQQMMEATAVGASIGQMTMANTAEYLTSTINGLQLSASDTMNIVDKFSYVADIAATG